MKMTTLFTLSPWRRAGSALIPVFSGSRAKIPLWAGGHRCAGLGKGPAPRQREIAEIRLRLISSGYVHVWFA